MDMCSRGRMNFDVGIEMLARDNGFCMSVGSDLLFLKTVYSPDQYWLPFVHAIYPTDKQSPEVEEPKKKSGHRDVLWSVPQRENPQIPLPFIEERVISKNHRKKLHAAKYPTFDRHPSGALLELKIIGETSGRKSKTSRFRGPRGDATSWCLENLRGRFIPHAYFVFELAEDYTLALLAGNYFEAIENPTRVV